jgi:hypothetical protein
MFRNKRIFEDLQTYVDRIEAGQSCQSVNIKDTNTNNSPSFKSSSDNSKFGTDQLGVFPEMTRIIAIGDIHGDFNALVTALYKANIMMESGEWNQNAKDTIVIQLGDLLDRKPRGNGIDSDDYMEEIHILQLIEHLHSEAQQFNSAFIYLVGNHEIMNMMGDFSYVSENTIEKMGKEIMNMMGDFSYVSENTIEKMGKEKRYKLFAAGGPIAKHIGCNSFGICKIGNWTFVHGGILPKHLNDEEFSFTKINELVKGLMYGTIVKDVKDEVKDEKGEVIIKALTDKQREWIYGSSGLFWTRELSEKGKQVDCSMVDDAVSILNDKNSSGGIVVGHSVQDRINSTCDNKVWRIDGGMSGAFGDNKNKIYVLEIRGNNTYII